MSTEYFILLCFTFFLGYIFNGLTRYFVRQLSVKDNYYNPLINGYQPDGSAKLNPIPPSGGTAKTPRP